MTSADPFSDLKKELVDFYTSKGSAWSGKLWADNFYSKTMADKDNVLAQTSKIMQEASSKQGGTSVELVTPGAIAQVLLSSCRSEQLAGMTRVQCMAAVLNESMLMQTMVSKKMDGIKK
jgi:hypothetical protein